MRLSSTTPLLRGHLVEMSALKVPVTMRLLEWSRRSGKCEDFGCSFWSCDPIMVGSVFAKETDEFIGGERVAVRIT